jgi:hypothetical protein
MPLDVRCAVLRNAPNLASIFLHINTYCMAFDSLIDLMDFSP